MMETRGPLPSPLTKWTKELRSSLLAGTTWWPVSGTSSWPLKNMARIMCRYITAGNWSLIGGYWRWGTVYAATIRMTFDTSLTPATWTPTSHGPPSTSMVRLGKTAGRTFKSYPFNYVWNTPITLQECPVCDNPPCTSSSIELTRRYLAPQFMIIHTSMV